MLDLIKDQWTELLMDLGWYQSNLMMRSLGHQPSRFDCARYCSLVNPSMKSKLDFNQNSKAVDFDQVHGCIFPKKYAACRASSLLISPHYSSAEADPYLPPAELRFLRKFQPFRIDGSTKWFTRIFGPRRESGRSNIAWASVIRAASTAKKLFNILSVIRAAELSILHHHTTTTRYIPRRGCSLSAARAR